MRKRASGCIYDDEMEALGYRRVGDIIDVAYGKYLDNGAWVSIVEDDIVGGLWYAAVAEDGWNYREVGESFDSPIAAHTYVSNVYGFKTGAGMRKKADDTSSMTLLILEKWARKEYDDALYNYRHWEFIDKEEASYWLGRANVIEEMFNLVNE